MKKIFSGIASFLLMVSLAVPVLASEESAQAEPFPVVKFIIIALVIGFIISFIINVVNRSKLRSVQKNNAAENYVVDGSLEITGSSEMFLYSKVVKTRRNTEQNNQNNTNNVNPNMRR